MCLSPRKVSLIGGLILITIIGHVWHACPPLAGQAAPAEPAFRTGGPLKASTQEALSAKDFPGLAKKISLDIKGMSIVDFLKFLAVEGNMNVAIAQDVAGSVNLLVNDVSIGDILKILFPPIIWPIRSRATSSRSFPAMNTRSARAWILTTSAKR